MIEIESLEELDRAIDRARRRQPLDGAAGRSRTSTSPGREEALEGLDPRGALFLGCTLSEEAAGRLRAGGALLFPSVPDVPFDPWRARLYTPAELYDGLEHGYDHTPDAAIYAWSRRAAERPRPARTAREVAARRLHRRRPRASSPQSVGSSGSWAAMPSPAQDSAYADAARLGHGLAAAG